jgi:hypothetical protein
VNKRNKEKKKIVSEGKKFRKRQRWKYRHIDSENNNILATSGGHLELNFINFWL